MERIQSLMMEGYCCSQIIFILGLEKMEKKNEDLVKAMAGLCKGMWLDKTCGTLSAAFCLLTLVDPVEAREKQIQELNQWFEETFVSSECGVLIGEDPGLTATLCPEIVRATFDKVCEMTGW